MGIKETEIKIKPKSPTQMTLAEIEQYVTNSETDYNGFYAAGKLFIFFKETGNFTVTRPTSTDFWTDPSETFNVTRFCVINIVEV